MDWLGPARARAWLLVLAATTWGLGALWVLLSRDGLDPAGRPLGTDFISFWTAGRLLVNGAGPAAPYDPHMAGLLQTATFHGADVGFTPFPYPPIFLLVCLPLGALPYMGALCAWLIATGAAYVLVLRRLLTPAPQRLLLLLAYPGVLLNAANGQNGFLTTALFGGAVLTLRRRPLVAGACLGALIFKPHLGILVPVALLAAGSWRALASAAGAVLTLAAVSVLLLGLQPWQGFLDYAPFMSKLVAQGILEPGKVQSSYAAVKLLGGGDVLAFTIQGLWAAGAALSLFMLGRRVGPGLALGASLVSATLIATPYLMPYDLVLAAIPMAWLFNEARRTGFLRWEKLLLLAGFVLPMLSLALGARVGVPVAPVVLVGLYLATFRRAWSAATPDRRAAGPRLAQPMTRGQVQPT